MCSSSQTFGKIISLRHRSETYACIISSRVPSETYFLKINGKIIKKTYPGASPPFCYSHARGNPILRVRAFLPFAGITDVIGKLLSFLSV
ncbi:MAG: hypothetical protein B6245_17110 [Desulfobacteraceae bacterium 4572_88]|nr:MAG: hypothetical protein B6245_17110 [Desulfobacteraceae bacterium 4572_88]RLC16502.1 MAG: hypothetical protein DRI57_11130 [Deltaproteobacteria bacterium]